MMKQTDTQQQRTWKKVALPAWVCNKMNNALDADWFCGLGAEETAGQLTVELPKAGRCGNAGVFLVCGAELPGMGSMRRAAAWSVTCGEVSSGVPVRCRHRRDDPVAWRIGILTARCGVVSENAATEDEWRKHATHAVQSTYGYEYQGDNLLLARVNPLAGTQYIW